MLYNCDPNLVHHMTFGNTFQIQQLAIDLCNANIWQKFLQICFKVFYNLKE